VTAGRSACAIATLAALAACGVAPYACIEDDQCVLGGRLGRCEPVGFCSYPDDACPSGARFSENADAPLAGRCVDAQTEGSSDGPPACGDAVVDGDEQCDDGNRRDGDGCNADCRPSGETRWSVTVAEGTAAAIASSATMVIAVGHDDDASVIVAVDAGGAPSWGALVQQGPGATRAARGVAIDGDDIWVVGEEDGPIDPRAWAQRLDATGMVVEPIAFDTPGDDRFVAVVPGPIAGGATLDGAWLRGLGDSTFEHLVPAVELRALTGRDDGVVAALLVGDPTVRVFAPGGALAATFPVTLPAAETIALARDGDVVIADPVTVVRTGVDGTLRWSASFAADVRIASVLEHEGDVRVAGTRGADGDARPWIARLAADGSLLFEHTLADEPPTEIAAAVARDDGSLVLVGTSAATMRLVAVER